MPSFSTSMDAKCTTVEILNAYEKKDIEVAAENLNSNPAAVLLRGAPFGPVTADESFSNVSWKLAADYQAADNVLLYASASSGFKSGGFTGSASTAAQATTPFDSERAISYEVGIKSKFADNRFLLNALGFFTCLLYTSPSPRDA